mmetsp:Transcript_3558/g.8907  ORF Transcript_3558/g.8907 Transcript_3558/m.8907 type:complete len:452 (+) Transcript_3558:72-1427(+)
MAVEGFFEALPQGELLPWELALREALLGALTGIAESGRKPFPVVEWIDRRVGGEIESRTSDEVVEILLRGEEPEEPRAPARQKATAAVAGAEGKRQSADFFSKLPTDRFLPWEENLRMALFRFLADWPSQTLATIHDVAKGQEIRDITRRALPQGVTVKDWVERRIGQEVEVETNNGDVINISAEARAIVTNLHSQSTKRAWPPGGAPVAMPTHPRVPSGPAARGPAHAGQDKEAFFAGLPGDELTQAELNLRQTLIDYVGKRGRAQTLLVDMATDKEVQRLKTGLLPTKVTLREWIERRIGGELECCKLEGGKIEVFLKSNGPANGSRGSQAAAARPESSEDKGRSEEKKEAFFANLPDDEFSPAEEALRDALLNFLASWKKPDPPTLSEAGPTPAVAGAKKSLLGSSGVSMKEWIDRRIGGEVETAPDAKGQVAFSRRGEMPPMKKRKT